MAGNSTARTATQVSTSLAQRATTATLGALIGLFLIYGVGFAQPETIHNAAHDTRHAASFPCH
jgi:cobalt transporter subunit CbtB